jgi:hypothetical protein
MDAAEGLIEEPPSWVLPTADIVGDPPTVADANGTVELPARDRPTQQDTR